MTPGWNIADIFDAIAARWPDAPAVDDVDRVWSWRDHERRAAGLAAAFVAEGVPRQARVGVCLRNCPEFLESYYAAMKAALVPVNVNYRYGADELVHLLDDADAELVVVGAEFLPVVAQAAPRLPAVRRWYVVGDAAAAETAGIPCTPYEQAVTTAPGPAYPRSGADLLFLYTGGTTGRPKGVMWSQAQLFEALVGSANKAMDLPPVRTVDDLLAALDPPGPRGVSASPLMHSTGLLNQWMVLLGGGTAVLHRANRYDARALLARVASARVSSLAIVGDAFARPMLAVLDAEPEAFDLSALQLVVSSGAVFGADVKQGLLKHLPWLAIYDAFGSSEGFGLGVSLSSAEAVPGTARFVLGRDVRVLRDDGTWVGPGETGTGRIAVTGALPEGYHKDPDRSARTWPVIDGVRYSVSGDYVAVAADGGITLLGRGSGCINTGGENVFPEEVDEVLKEHPAVADAACAGVPDPRLGSAVHAVVALRPGATAGADELAAHVKARLASYKAPRRVLLVEAVPRTVLGKVDYPALAALLAAPGSRP